MVYKPIEIAKKLNISTSALRHYERWGVVPLPERAANGYRIYTEVHFAYFQCLRNMSPGFGIGLTCNILRHIQQNDIDAAFWLVNNKQAELQQHKIAADYTLQLLEHLELPTISNRKLKQHMSIGEAALLTGITTSAIRHWEKEGLLKADRDPDNNYRRYSPAQVRTLLLIRTLKTSIHDISIMKEIIQAMEQHGVEHAKKVTSQALRSIHEQNRQQMIGIHQLVELCNLLKIMPTS